MSEDVSLPGRLEVSLPGLEPTEVVRVARSEGCKVSILVALTSSDKTTNGLFVSKNASSIFSTSATCIGLDSS
jgi:hypothetical protein